jgi:hypothetical protein
MMSLGLDHFFPISQSLLRTVLFQHLTSAYSAFLRLSLLEKCNRILHCLLKMLWSKLLSGKYTAKLNTLFCVCDLRAKCRANILKMSRCQETEKQLCLAVDTQNQHRGKLLLPFLSEETGSFNNNVKCISGHIFSRLFVL